MLSKFACNAINYLLYHLIIKLLQFYTISIFIGLRPVVVFSTADDDFSIDEAENRRSEIIAQDRNGRQLGEQKKKAP